MSEPSAIEEEFPDPIDDLRLGWLRALRPDPAGNVGITHDELVGLISRIDRREAFLRMVDDDNDEYGWDQADEVRRLTMALEAVRDTDDLHLAASVLYGTQPAIAREFLRRKHAAEVQRDLDERVDAELREAGIND
jgi:hypothetical protein